MFSPGCLCVFFKEGPFAWNGIFAWYIPITFFSLVWLPVNTWLFLRATKGVPLSEESEQSHDAVVALTQELARVRLDLDGVLSTVDNPTTRR
jgi:hypothetical protein